jgi:ATP-dependent RNA helicase DDX10/DBP4
VGKQHQISAGLVIGGKDFEYEREKVGRMNVLVATPGRMLHHMDHVADLDCSALKMLVLDEADRILDMGFAKTLDAILQNLPRHDRQTLLFSATQTKSVKALARLSLRSPEYVSVMSSTTRGNSAGTHPSATRTTAVGGGCDPRCTAAESREEDADEDAAGGIRIAGTPRGLSQSYAVIEPHEKLSVLWSFIKTHLSSKVIVFFATGKQVRFTFEAFCKLRPGIPLLHIHGNMKQMKRTEMYDQFCKTRSAVLFATDVASRGLDFPNVEWVVQVDCPDDVGSYVHRVGRTARFTSNGRAMLLLARGAEEMFLTRLESQKLYLNRVRINPERTMSISQRIAALSASSQELKKLGQRAFTFYLKSVLRQQDKQVFNAVDIDHAALAKSFGLSLAPRVSFKGITTGQITSGVANLEEKEGDRRKSVFGYRPRPAKFMDEGLSNQDLTQKTTVGSMNNPDSQVTGEGEDVLILKRVHLAGREDDVDASGMEGQLGEAGSLPVQQRPRKRLKLDVLKSGPSLTNRIVFTDDGRAVRASELVEDKLGLSQVANRGEASTDLQIVDAELANDIEEYAAIVAKRLAITSKADKDREHGRVRVKHAKQRDRERGRANPNYGNGTKDVGDKEDLSSDDCVSSESSADEFDDALARIASGASKGLERDSDMKGEVRNDDNTGMDTDACDVRSQEELALRIIAQRGL